RSLRERLDRAGGTRERAIRLVEFLRRVLEMAAELIVKLDEPLELTAHRRDALLQLTRALLHREPANAKRDDLEICEERVRRRRDHLALGTVRAQVRLPFLLAQHEVVVDGFRRYVHHGKVDRPVRRRDVPSDRIDMPAHLLKERALLRAA